MSQNTSTNSAQNSVHITVRTLTTHCPMRVINEKSILVSQHTRQLEIPWDLTTLLWKKLCGGFFNVSNSPKCLHAIANRKSSLKETFLNYQFKKMFWSTVLRKDWIIFLWSLQKMINKILFRWRGFQRKYFIRLCQAVTWNVIDFIYLYLFLLLYL